MTEEQFRLAISSLDWHSFFWSLESVVLLVLLLTWWYIFEMMFSFQPLEYLYRIKVRRAGYFGHFGNPLLQSLSNRPSTSESKLTV